MVPLSPNDSSQPHVPLLVLGVFFKLLLLGQLATWEPIDNVHASEVTLYAKANGLENHELFRDYISHLDVSDDEDSHSEQPYLHRSDAGQEHSPVGRGGSDS